MEWMWIKLEEFYQRNVFGNIVLYMFFDYGEFFVVLCIVKCEVFELFLVFIKRERDIFECVGNLCKNGGILVDQFYDVLYILRFYLYSSLKKEVDRYFIVLKFLFIF